MPSSIILVSCLNYSEVLQKKKNLNHENMHVYHKINYQNSKFSLKKNYLWCF